MEKEFEDMLALGWQILTEGPQQVLLCRTSDGEIHYASLWHIEEGDHMEESELLRKLEGKTVTHIIALWEGGCVDLPSMDFREKLRAESPDSQNALVLLQTGSGQLGLPLSMFFK